MKRFHEYMKSPAATHDYAIAWGFTTIMLVVGMISMMYIVRYNNKIDLEHMTAQSQKQAEYNIANDNDNIRIKRHVEETHEMVREFLRKRQNERN